MRNAALTLGIIAGVIGMIVGFFGWGYTEVINRFGEVPDVAEQVDNIGLVRAGALLAPLCAIVGGAMARSRALWGGVLLLISAGGMYAAFGFNAFTMFPISFAGLGGVLAIAAGQPDEEKAHF
ncbi:hypothetical protein [Shimia abyssi]|uniref:Major facilitator superfamily (MFS) profile domain-containing protein n=1 Tax=Shimia abyssi TaxID=1662395 RepID=A0A2P8FJ90_9RHOB|nr:hypothetical protein [Shimia abyssi]PSL21792.1 hypothetical protein CLV88_101216 [Shimia abyssi]